MIVTQILDYLVFAILLFFITFFIDIFYYYFRYRRVIPRKMLTFKRGGLFEHYRIVGMTVLVLVLIHAIFGINPFPQPGEEANALSMFIEAVTFYLPVTVFMIFIFIFAFYMAHSLYAKARNIEDRKQYLIERGHRIVVLSVVFGLIVSSAIMGLVLIQAF